MVDVQVAPASLGSHMPELNSEEEEEDEQWLEVAAQFVSLVLEDQPGARPLGGGKSPAASKLAPGAAREPPTSTAPEVAVVSVHGPLPMALCVEPCSGICR